MERKEFMHIARIKFGDELTTSNIDGFNVGNNIQITEKIDGCNASIRYDVESNKLVAFSRNNELSYDLTLNGFWNYAQTLNPDEYKDTPNYVIFGEWLVKHTVIYREDAYRKWYVFDIFDMDKQEYLPQSEVKEFVKKHNLLYVHVLYEGDFISWEHCKSFLNSPVYGDMQEGIVVKNLTNLNNINSNDPFVLKILNDQFAEIKKSNHIRKLQDPQKIQEKEYAQEIAEQIVTENRIRKEILKMQDEGILPEKIAPQNMKTVAMYLPERIYDDCIEEEYELITSAGEYFGKACNSRCMQLARKLLLG